MGPALDRLHRHEEVTFQRRDLRAGATQTAQRRTPFIVFAERPAFAKTDRPVLPSDRVGAV
jgi:hypothetical protein